METQQHDIPNPCILNSEDEWRAELNAVETMAGQIRERLQSLKQSAMGEAKKGGKNQTADWWQTATERLDNGISGADQISDTLTALDCDLPEFSRP